MAYDHEGIAGLRARALSAGRRGTSTFPLPLDCRTLRPSAAVGVWFAGEIGATTGARKA
jgi:hypothetical protein